MLTIKQQDVLKAISDLSDELGFSPTFEEIGKRVNLHSKSTVSGHVDRLVKKQLLTKSPYGPRTLKITEKGKELLNEK